MSSTTKTTSPGSRWSLAGSRSIGVAPSISVHGSVGEPDRDAGGARLAGYSDEPSNEGPVVIRSIADHAKWYRSAAGSGTVALSRRVSRNRRLARRTVRKAMGHHAEPCKAHASDQHGIPKP